MIYKRCFDHHGGRHAARRHAGGGHEQPSLDRGFRGRRAPLARGAIRASGSRACGTRWACWRQRASGGRLLCCCRAVRRVRGPSQVHVWRPLHALRSGHAADGRLGAEFGLAAGERPTSQSPSVSSRITHSAAIRLLPLSPIASPPLQRMGEMFLICTISSVLWGMGISNIRIWGDMPPYRTDIVLQHWSYLHNRWIFVLIDVESEVNPLPNNPAIAILAARIEADYLGADVFVIRMGFKQYRAINNVLYASAE